VKSRYVEAHPNPDAESDARRVIVAVITLVLLGLFDLANG
jgi:hypothetical protein